MAFKDTFAEDGKVAFNMSIETLKRINVLLWQTNECQSHEDFYGWYNTLLNLWKEIYGTVKLKDEEITEVDNEILGLREVIGKNVAGQNRINLFNALYKLERMIRFLMRKYDITMMSKGDIGLAFLK